MSYIPVEHRVLVFNSKDRLSGTPSNFTISINESVQRISSIFIEYVSIPVSFYSINSSNNSLTVTSGTATVAPGNYDVYSFASALQTSLKTLNTNYTVTYNVNTGKITIANTSISFIVDADSPMAALLGFTADTALSSSATGDNLLNLSGPHYVGIKSSYFRRLIKYGVTFTGPNTEDIICNIENNRSFNDFLGFNGSTSLAVQTKTNINASDVIDLSLVDENGSEIDLNGIEWHMRIVCIVNQFQR